MSARDSVWVEIAVAMELGYGRPVASGTLKLFAVQALALAAGLLIAAFLTRQLGPELYGLFTVVATIVIWVELSATMMFSHTTMKFVAQAVDWRTVASTLAHAQLLVSLGATVLLVAAATTTALPWLRAGLTMLAVYRHRGLYPAPATILRTTLTTLIAYALSSAWHASGAWVIVELIGVTAVILICLFLLGELTGQDLAFARSLLRRERAGLRSGAEQEL